MWKWILGVLATVVGGVLLQMSTNFLGLNGGGGGGGGGHEIGGPSNTGDSNTGGGMKDNGVDPIEIVVMKPLEEGINRQGNDFDAYGKPAGNAELCAEMCKVNSDCDSMTYVKSTGLCWMKHGVPPVRSDPDMISAVKDRHASEAM